MDFCITKYGWKKTYKKSRFKKAKKRLIKREMQMVKLIFDDWSWRCENCKSTMALPGIVPSLEMLKEKGWKYCPVCGKKIDFKASESDKPKLVK